MVISFFNFFFDPYSIVVIHLTKTNDSLIIHLTTKAVIQINIDDVEATDTEHFKRKGLDFIQTWDEHIQSIKVDLNGE